MARKKNPTGTLLVNKGSRRGKSRKIRRRRNPGVSLSSLFAVSNPKRRKARGSKRRSATRRHSARRNPLVFNPKRRKARAGKRRASSHKRRTGARRRNPLVFNNPKRRKARAGKRRHASRRRNPLYMSNPKRRHSKARRHTTRRRRNPSSALAGTPGRAFFQKYVGKVQGLARRIPLAGGALAAAFGVVGSVLGGAVGVLPVSYAMPYVAKYVPDWLKPYGYSVAGMVISGVISAIPFRIPYKEQLVIGVAAAGGAVDVYRWRHGKSMDLGDEYGSLLSDDEVGDDEYGDDELGDDGSAFASVEFADANLGDIDFCGDDFSSDELAALELGRRNFRRKFLKPGSEGAEEGASNSEHAGIPGRRWGWLIFWIGHENAAKLGKMNESERREFIAKAKHEARLRARKLLGDGLPTTMQAAETAGLLVAA